MTTTRWNQATKFVAAFNDAETVAAAQAAILQLAPALEHDDLTEAHDLMLQFGADAERAQALCDTVDWTALEATVGEDALWLIEAGVRYMVRMPQTAASLLADMLTGSEMTTTTNILEALNTYAGDNIWQDVIYGAMDVAATETRFLDSDSDDFIGTDGLHYGYRPQAFNGPWIIVED